MKAAVAVLAVIVLGVGGYFALHRTANSVNAIPPDTIIFNGNSFKPSSISVKAGANVTVKNESSVELLMHSDPHSVTGDDHPDDVDLQVGAVLPGQLKTFTVHKQGTYGYHDHLDDNVQGKITIE